MGERATEAVILLEHQALEVRAVGGIIVVENTVDGGDFFITLFPEQARAVADAIMRGAELIGERA